MKTLDYAAKRVVLFFPILFGVSVIVFFLIHLVPGSPAAAMLGVRASPERVAALERQLGLHQPLHVQYIDWLTNALTGDFGESFSHRTPVSELLLSRFWISFELVVLTLITSGLISIPFGILAALNKNTLIDYFSIGFGVVGVSIPTFFSSVLLIAIFAVQLDVLPTSGYVPPSESIIGNIQHMVLPVFAMTLVAVAVTMRMMRSSMLETIGAPYIRFLRSKGLKNRSILFIHALKNSFIPVITLIGLQFGYLLSGAVVVEEIFAIPGIGRTVLQAVLQRDYPLIQGTVLLLALWFASVNLITDLIVAYLDPRILEDA